MRYNLCYLLILIICLCTFTGCVSSSEKDEKKFIEAIDNVIENENLELLENYKINDETILHNDEVLTKAKEMIDSLVKTNPELLNSALNIMENKIYYKYSPILTYLNSSLTNESLEEKLKLMTITKSNNFYIFNNITQEDIDNYPEDKIKTFYSEAGENGYYDNKENRMIDQNRKILSNGDILSTSYSYYGDFAVEYSDKEYVDSYYQIKHLYSHYMYFKGCQLSNLSNIDKMLYIDSYLLSYTDSNIQVYNLNEENNKCISSTYLGVINK